MNKYKINLIYKDNGPVLTEIIIKSLINEINMIHNNDSYPESILYNKKIKDLEDKD